MSLPSEKIEWLLNEYLDDALQGADLAFVQQALAEDAEASERLDALRRERAERLAAMQTDPRFEHVRLGAGFSERVLQAIAREQAVANESAPSVSRKSQDPTERIALAERDRPVRWQRGVVIAVGLAAAFLLAVTLFPRPKATEVAQREETPAERQQEKTPERTPAVVQGSQRSDQNAAPDMMEVANADTVASPSDTATPQVADALPVVEELDPQVAAMPAMNLDVAVDNGSASSPDQVAVPGQDPRMPLNVVMVFEVTRTELGKSNGAVMEALRAAGIDVRARQPVDQKVVGFLQQAKIVGNQDDSERAAIVYIEASGKALDRFMVSMFTDTDHIGQIRWNMAMDPPLLAAVKQLHRFTETEVRHAADDSAAWQLVSGEGREADFRVHSDARPLLPLKREGWDAVGSASQETDIQGRLILLVR